jgi:hypothetical protein
MYAEALPLAVAASFYPIGLLLVLRYLAGDDGTRRGLAFLAGAVASTAATGLVIFFALEALPFTGHGHPTAGWVLELVLGVLALGFGWYLLRPRPGKETSTDEPDEEDVAAGLGRCVIIGMLAYLPGAAYVAAINVISQSSDGAAEKAVALALCIVIVPMMVWVPLIAVKLFPEKAAPLLERFSTFLSVRGRTLLALLLIAVGFYLIARGITAAVS